MIKSAQVNADFEELADGTAIESGAITNTKLGSLSVSNGKIQDDAVTHDKINITCKVSAYKTVAQNNVTAGQYNQVTLETENFDIGGNFASSTFTAPVSGYYLIIGQVKYTGQGQAEDVRIAIYKNDVLFSEKRHDYNYEFGTDKFVAIDISRIMLLSASNTVKLYFYNSDASPVADLPASADTYLDIHLLSS